MNRFLFEQTNGSAGVSMYSSDGTAGGTVDLDISRFLYYGASSNPDYTLFNGETAFIGYGNQSPGLFLTDGTAAGTSFTSINVDVNDLEPENLDLVDGKLIISFDFNLANAKNSYMPDSDELWSTTNGTSFTQINTGIAVGSGGIVESGDLGYFNAIQNGPQYSQVAAGLWRTDGTSDGTYEIDTGPNSAPSDVVSLGNGRAIYASNPGFGDYGLYLTDGSRSSGTEIANASLGENILPEYGGASTGSRAIFSAIDAAGNISAWSTDGTPAGTVEIVVNGPANDPIRIPNSYMQLGDKVVFDNGYGLFITDGTTNGTMLLYTGGVQDETVAGGKVFFFTGPASTGPSISISDGTVAGTVAIAVPGMESYNPGSMKTIGNAVVFTGIDTAGHTALFGSDGTAAGTGELALPAGFDPSNITAVGPLPIVTTTNPPVLILGPGDVVYNAPAGQAVVAGGGNDTVVATAGYVTVTGGAGKLTFFGGTGPSSVFGGDGSSIIFGGAGGGHFIGGTAGNNILISQGAAGGNTTLTGGGAGDQIFGSASGSDVLIAGNGRESILGGGGPTTIQGGAAADVIFTGSGSTVVHGGTGAADTIVGGSGALAVTANAGDAIFGNAGHLAVTGSISGADSIIGGSGGLAVTGHGGNMLVVAGSGTSTIATGNGASLIFEGTGNSTVTGGNGLMEVVVGSGRASVTEGKGPASFEVVRGSAGGADILSGFKVGTDTINLFGYSATDVHISIGSGNTLISLADGTRITVIGVTDVGKGLIF